jgi:hypothetical protein
VASPIFTEGAGSARALYVTATAGHLVRLEPADGKATWTFDVQADAQQKPVLFSTPAVRTVDDKGGHRRIYVGCALSDFTRGILYCLEEDPAGAKATNP